MMHTLRRGAPAFYRDTADEERDTRMLHARVPGFPLQQRALFLSFFSLCLSTIRSRRPGPRALNSLSGSFTCLSLQRMCDWMQPHQFLCPFYHCLLALP